MMNITSVTVRRLKTTSNYNNVAVEAQSPVGPDQDPAKVREELDLWVQSQIEGRSIDAMKAEQSQLSWEVDSLKRERAKLTADNEALKRNIEKLRKTPIEEAMKSNNDDEQPF